MAQFLARHFPDIFQACHRAQHLDLEEAIDLDPNGDATHEEEEIDFEPTHVQLREIWKEQKAADK